MSRHNRRQELIEEFGYCECDWSSPSSHHDCCINKGCGKVIKTTGEKLSEAYAEIAKLKAQLAESEPLPRCIQCNVAIKKKPAGLYCSDECYESKESSWYCRSITGESND